MPGWFDEYPTRELLNLRKAWRDHYIAKGCSAERAFWLAAKKTYTWP
jgi:hypothetical protein